MTLGDACETVDRLAGNQIELEMKVKWLSTLDSMLHREILLRHQGTCCAAFGGYSGETDPDQELLAPEPYDEIYRWYLEMQIHDANGEILKYNNAAQRFNRALLAYGDWVNRTCMPLGAEGLRLV